MISSSVIDYFGRRWAVYYGMQRIYSLVSVGHKVEGNTVSFTLFNDRAKEYTGALTYKVMDNANRELHRGVLECDLLAPMESVSLGSVDLTDYVSGYERERYLTYSYSDGVQMRECTVLFAKSKHFAYRPLDLRATVTGSANKFDVTLYPSGYVGRLKLGFSTVDAVFSENCIDIVDTAPRRISLETAEVVSAERLESELTFTCLNGIDGLD